MRGLILSLLLFSSTVFASTTWDTKVHDIDHGTPGELVLVFFSTGQVGKLTVAAAELLTPLQDAQRLGHYVQVTMSPLGMIEAVGKSDKVDPPRPFFSALKSLSTDYVPSVLPSFDEARRLFHEMRKSPVLDSECWQRAHVWAFEWRINQQLYTSKAWIFFTRKYVRENPDLGWWFHVAPMVHVNIDGVVKERIMDKKHSNGPLMIKRWTDSFLRDRAHCRVVDTYSDHANYQDSASCFIQKTSMYYVQPADLESLEKFGALRNQWVEAELVDAYAKAFHITITKDQGE